MVSCGFVSGLFRVGLCWVWVVWGYNMYIQIAIIT